LTDLLPRSGIAVSQGTVGYYGSILLALFLLGWGLSMVWGPISDRIGRVRALMLTILCYSLFTFLCGLVTNIWQLAVLRVFVGSGIGGEQPVGAAYLAEELSESQRKIGAGLMHTGYYFGFFFASVANYFIGANYGWRWMFVFGGFPALLSASSGSACASRRSCRSASGDNDTRRVRDARCDCHDLLAPYVRRTMVMSGLFLTSIIGLWAGSIYVPTATTQLAVRVARAPRTPRGKRRTAGWCSRLERSSAAWRRRHRRTSRPAESDGHLLRPSWGSASSRVRLRVLPAGAAISLFYWCIFLLGFGGANFALYTVVAAGAVPD
jgi:MFS family permease